MSADLMLFSSLAYSLSLKIEPIRSSETVVDFRRTRSCYIQEIELFIVTAVSSSNPVTVVGRA
jgi:hypothetical protein